MPPPGGPVMLVDQVTGPAVHRLAGERARAAARRSSAVRVHDGIAAASVGVDVPAARAKKLREARLEEEPLADGDLGGIGLLGGLLDGRLVGTRGSTTTVASRRQDCGEDDHDRDSASQPYQDRHSQPPKSPSCSEIESLRWLATWPGGLGCWLVRSNTT